MLWGLLLCRSLLRTSSLPSQPSQHRLLLRMELVPGTPPPHWGPRGIWTLLTGTYARKGASSQLSLCLSLHLVSRISFLFLVSRSGLQRTLPGDLGSTASPRYRPQLNLGSLSHPGCNWPGHFLTWFSSAPCCCPLLGRTLTPTLKRELSLPSLVEEGGSFLPAYFLPFGPIP